MPVKIITFFLFLALNLVSCAQMSKELGFNKPSEPVAPKKFPDEVKNSKGEVILSRHDIQATITAHQRELQVCYNKSLKRVPRQSMPNMQGKLIMEWSVNPEGKVTGSKVRNNETGDEELGYCIVDAAKSWQFPKSSDGSAMTIYYPFYFTLGKK